MVFRDQGFTVNRNGAGIVGMYHNAVASSRSDVSDSSTLQVGNGISGSYLDNTRIIAVVVLDGNSIQVYGATGVSDHKISCLSFTIDEGEILFTVILQNLDHIVPVLFVSCLIHNPVVITVDD